MSSAFGRPRRPAKGTLLAGLALLAFLSAGLAAACGDDDNGEPLTLAEYFDRLEEAATEFEEEGSGADDRLTEAIFDASSPDEQVDLFKDFIGDSQPIIENFVEDLEEINPPPEALEAHEQAVAAGQALVEAFETLRDGIDEAGSPEDAQALLENDNVTEASDDFTDACEELQQIAEDSEITVDLLCGDNE